MPKLTKIVLHTYYLFPFLSPCMDVMVSFYNGIESHSIYLLDNMFDYTVRLICLDVEGVAKVSQNPV